MLKHSRKILSLLLALALLWAILPLSAQAASCGPNPEDHFWGAWSQIAAPSATSDGEILRKCVVCGAEDSRIIPKNPFTDVKADRFEEAILWAYYKGITTGTGDGSTFSPENSCTRKQIVTFLWRAAGEPEPKSMVNPFTDVKSDRFEKPILWAYYEGITSGTGNGSTFSPENTCTRKQIVTFLWRFHGEPNPKSMVNPFVDVKADRFEKAILWAFNEGITSGTGNGSTFSPENPCTRKQIVTFLYRDKDNLVEPENLLEFAEGTRLRMATGYNNVKTGLSFSADVTGVVGITLADGVTYYAGDLKPTWVEVQKRLGVNFENKYTGAGSAIREFQYWQERLYEVDMVSANLSAANEAGEAGELVNIAEHLDKMPNFKAFLEANPTVRLSITGDTGTGSFYIAPYFDGINDVERVPLMRTDWVEKLLNGEGEFMADASNLLAPAAYTPYMPTFGSVAVDVVEPDGKTVMTIRKDYDKAGNIIENMNDALAAGRVDGVTAVNMLRKYIDEAYSGYYGTNRADLFIGQNAAWDADELVALLRCVVANPQTLNKTDTVYGLFSREDNNNQRRVDMYRFAATLFGVRGLESRQDYLYIDSDGKLHDARQETATYEALERMNAMTQEGLIARSFLIYESEKTQTMLSNDLGFMHYDFSQTQTIFNGTVLSSGEQYRAVMIPVARWYDGTSADGIFMRFTESWRSVKTDGWAISAEGVKGDRNKLNAALKLIDYAYSPEGMILMSYGPDAFIKTKADGSYVTFNFNGEEMPVMADAANEEMWDLTSGNYTNYARQYLGSCLSFVKSQAFEYQCTHEVGQIGMGYISNAIGLGTIKHPELAVCDNPWYTSLPTVLPSTAEENAMINSYTSLSSNFGTAKGQENLFVDQIRKGYTWTEMNNAANSASYVASTMKGAQYLLLKQDAFDRLVAFYDTLK